MESHEKTAAAIVEKMRKKLRSVLVKPWMGRRINLCLYKTLVQESRSTKNSYARHHRTLVRFLVPLIQDDITKTNTNMRDSTPTNIFSIQYTQI